MRFCVFVLRACSQCCRQADFYDFSATTLDGKDTKMSDYKGKPVLILNVASL